MRRLLSAFLTLTALSSGAWAADDTCSKLPDHDRLTAALEAARAEKNGGFNLEMWGAVVDRAGKVCAVAKTGDTVDAQWPLSRLIAAEKANTANALSLKSFALSTANLFAGTQSGGFLYGVNAADPVDPAVAHAGPVSAFGSAADPLVGKMLGGEITFGGGLALYDQNGEILGGLGVSGDSSCADHNIAWRTRHGLKLDYVAAGPSKNKDDNITYDIALGKSKSGFGHAECGGSEKEIAAKLPAVRKAGSAE